MMRNDQLLTVPEILEQLGGVSRRTFYRWRELGHAPNCIKLPNGELRLWRSELMVWLETLREAA
ncbi:helix-turn-helix transcriptional regulator [Microtetraspora glauca]|uniref:Helix-turn-helix domain-containing protein n=1 Tax=Microtetraspora glauca TaxID=1996 RepID=A0ABV3GIB6_MICGL